MICSKIWWIFLILSLLHFCATTANSAAFHRMLFMNRFALLNSQLGSADQNGQKCDEKYFSEEFFHQTSDHFGDGTVAKWKQKYQTNLRYFNESREGPAVFLVVGGEFGLNFSWICREDFAHMKMARKHQSIVVQLEHRFFGDNTASGLDDLSLSKLRLLTSDNALADIADFIPHFNAEHNLTNPRWIIIGFSYAGTLAAWFKAKYPDLSAGAVAISAPIWPKTDFWEYEEMMEKTIREINFNCYREIGVAFKEIEQKLNTEDGRRELTILFRANPSLSGDPLDLASFLNMLLMSWQHAVQSPSRNLLQKGCNLMTNISLTAQQRLFAMFRMVLLGDDQPSGDQHNQVQVDFSYGGIVKALANTHAIDPEHAMMRAWIWMTCNEFGWFQTTDRENSLFGQTVSIGYFYQLCSDIFGSEIGAKYIESRIYESRQKYGDGCTYKAKNIILTNGIYDPWSAVSIQHGFGCKFDGKNVEEKDGIIAVWTPRASHCAEMLPPSTDEPGEFELTRQKVNNAVAKFLRNDAKKNGAIRGIIFALFVPLLVPFRKICFY